MLAERTASRNVLVWFLSLSGGTHTRHGVPLAAAVTRPPQYIHDGVRS